MDANGLRFWMLADRADWALSKEVAYESATLCLSGLRADRRWPGVRPEAEVILDQPPQAIDSFDRIAFVRTDAGGSRVKSMRVGGDRNRARTIFQFSQITDIAPGADATLFIAAKDCVYLRDMHFGTLQRWRAVGCAAEGLKPFRLAADPEGGCWVLCADGILGRVTGRPFPDLARERYADEVIRPRPENPDAPRLTAWSKAPIIGAGEKPACICHSPQDGVAVIAWTEGDARLYLPLRGAALTLTGMPFPTSARWLGNGRLALLYPGATESAIYDVERGFVGDLYPLNGPRHPLNEPFLQTGTGEPYFLRNGVPRKLLRVSLPSLARQGSAAGSSAFDSGGSGTVWHRLYLEAAIPTHCWISVAAAASQSDDPLQVGEWHEHRFGETVPGKPSGVWLPEPSEVPFHPGLLPGPSEPDRSGLFTVLLQRVGKKSSQLRGRYLHVRVTLGGTEQATPRIAALRAYASRFSYVEHYLPELFRETALGPDGDAASPSTTPADFLNRFLCLFESFLTPLEDRVASAHLLTHPAGTRDQDLEWLAQWLGVSFDPVLAPARRREWLRRAPELARWRGTLYGLALALEVATGGGVSGGEIILVENYRLRRVVATILGVDLTDYDDPLLPGADYGGNSIVGDTLVLGDEFDKQFLAMFAANLKTTAAESLAIASLFEELAHRATVLVHQEVAAQDLALIRRIAEREKPAGIEVAVATAAFPFMTGIASLVGVDTYLARKPQPEPVRVGYTRLGVWNVVRQPGSLDPYFRG